MIRIPQQTEVEEHLTGVGYILLYTVGGHNTYTTFSLRGEAESSVSTPKLAFRHVLLRTLCEDALQLWY